MLSESSEIVYGDITPHMFMMTSSNGNIFRVTGFCEGNSPETGEFPSQSPVTRSVDVFFDLRRNKRLSKQSRRRWFETPSRPLWRHYIVIEYIYMYIYIYIYIEWTRRPKGQVMGVRCTDDETINFLGLDNKKDIVDTNDMKHSLGNTYE